MNSIDHPPDGRNNGAADSSQPPASDPAVISIALDYHRRGLSVVPQMAGAKRPCLKWKPFQEKRPGEAELRTWFTQLYPNAGVAAVLGPVSNLFVIDVDGEEAHRELTARLGEEPRAPRVLSGSGQPFHYHLFFRHPAVATRAKITPWHPRLEFRGNGGLVVLPPSLHESGHRYEWAPGQSLDDLTLPEVPALILEALVVKAAHDAAAAMATSTVTTAVPALSAADLTAVQGAARRHLAGLPPAVQGQGGDRHTYRAACDLVIGFGLTVEQALPILREWNLTHCVPPWTEERLVHKLGRAAKQPGERGRLLRAFHLEQAQARRAARKAEGGPNVST